MAQNTPIPSPFIRVPLLRTREVMVMTQSDFTVDNVEAPINLKTDDCTIVLFYGNNQESEELGEIFAIVANDTVGPVFGSVNLFTEQNLAKIFTKLQGDITHPQHRFALRGYPEIIVFRKGSFDSHSRPVGKYNGGYDTGLFRQFVTTQACTATWNEPITLAGGIARPNEVTYQRPQNYIDLPGGPKVVKTNSAELTPADVRRIGGGATVTQNEGQPPTPAPSPSVPKAGPKVAR